VKVRELHPWNVTPAEARQIQISLRRQVELEDRLPRIRRVAGADVAFDVTRRRALAGVVVYALASEPSDPQAGLPGSFELQELERVWAEARLDFPYVPGLLSFREAPALLAAFRKVRHAPDVIFCDAQGYAHPRRFGLACHLGVLLDCPSIGCAKSRLIGTHGEPARAAGSWAPLTDSSQQCEVIGAVLRTRAGVNPVYISQGHGVSLTTAINLTLAVCDGLRIPRPTRDADRFVAHLKRR
jgi:deoxyribonuclease V